MSRIGKKAIDLPNGVKASVADGVVTVEGKSKLTLTLPPKVKVTVTDNVKLTVEGADKQLVGETAATIRRFRKPEPYKGKGIRYVNEQVILKEGKSVG